MEGTASGGDSAQMNTRLLRRVWSILAVSALLSVGIWGRLVLPNPVDAVNASFEYGAEAPYIGSISEVRARSTQAVNGGVSQAAWLVVDFEYKPDFAASGCRNRGTGWD